MGWIKDDYKMRIWNILASVRSGILGVMGFGGGGIMIIYLTIVQKTKQMNKSDFFIPFAIIALIIHIKIVSKQE